MIVRWRRRIRQRHRIEYPSIPLCRMSASGVGDRHQGPVARVAVGPDAGLFVCVTCGNVVR